MSKRKEKSRGNATIEFTLVGIPIIFVLISIAEMARGMWTYHSLAHAIKEGTRYAIVHGQNSPNHGTYQSVCSQIIQAGPGLLAQDLTLTFHSASQADVTTTADKCSTGIWPPGGTDGSGNTIPDDQPGATIMITGGYPFASALSMFWPGGGSGINFTPPPANPACSNKPGFCLPAASSDVVQY